MLGEVKRLNGSERQFGELSEPFSDRTAVRSTGVQNHSLQSGYLQTIFFQTLVLCFTARKGIGIKMNKFQKITAMLLAITSVMTVSSCGQKKEDEIATLTWCLPANDLRDKDAVVEEINKITVPEIGAKVNIQEYDFGTYTEKMRMKMASGDDTYDILFVGYLNNYHSAVDNGVLEPLSKLIDKSAPELKDAVPGYVWKDAVCEDDEVYAVPNAQIMATQYSFGIQKKLAEKYGWTKTEISSPEELEPFLKQIKENEPSIYPYRPNYGLNMWLTNYTAIAGGVAINEDTASDEVVFIRNTEEYQRGIDTLRDWFLKGYIRKDAASVSDDNTDFNQLRYAVYNSTWKPGQETLYPDYMYVKIGTPRIANGASLSTMNGINRLSKNKEKAIKLISLINTNKNLYNLMSLGIEGKHYTLDENGKYKPIDDSGYGISGWVIGNQFNALVAYNQDDDVWEQTNELNAKSKESKLRGFDFDPDPVKSENMAISGVSGEYTAMNNGTRDKSEYWDDMNARLKTAGEDKVLEEVQKQVNAFLAERN